MYFPEYDSQKLNGKLNTLKIEIPDHEFDPVGQTADNH